MIPRIYQLLVLLFPNFVSSTGQAWFEIYLNASYLSSSSFDLAAYVFNHELLHALGLEHPFDDSDGDFYKSTNPLFSATPDETTMSYRFPESGSYPTDISSSDYAALRDIWGYNSSELSDSLFPPQDIYRLYDMGTDRHLFSSNQIEIDLLTGHPDSLFINEGIAYNVGPGASTPLHRFYNTSTGGHFYSSSDNEKT